MEKDLYQDKSQRFNILPQPQIGMALDQIDNFRHRNNHSQVQTQTNLFHKLSPQNSEQSFVQLKQQQLENEQLGKNKDSLNGSRAFKANIKKFAGARESLTNANNTLRMSAAANNSNDKGFTRTGNLSVTDIGLGKKVDSSVALSNRKSPRAGPSNNEINLVGKQVLIGLGQNSKAIFSGTGSSQKQFNIQHGDHTILVDTKKHLKGGKQTSRVANVTVDGLKPWTQADVNEANEYFKYVQSSQESVDQIIFAKGMPIEKTKGPQDETKKPKVQQAAHKANANKSNIQQDAIMGTDEILSLQKSIEADNLSSFDQAASTLNKEPRLKTIDNGNATKACKNEDKQLVEVQFAKQPLPATVVNLFDQLKK